MGSNPTRPTTDQPGTFHAQFAGVITNHILWLQREGYKPQTIESHSRILRHLAKQCNLSDPESVREYLANHRASAGRKENIVGVYSLFSKQQGIAFSKPRYTREDSLPFVPLQQEMEAILQAATNLRHSTLLRLLYETGMRIGEGHAVTFKSFDFERRTVRVVPEKGSRARELKISPKLCALVMQFYAKYPDGMLPDQQSARKHLGRVRRSLAKISCNPRFLNVHLHTFRHFRAIYEYHRTKDLLYVQQILGHRSISNTVRYARFVDWETDEYIAKAAKNLEEASKLIESGFDYVTEMDSVKLFRKRK